MIMILTNFPIFSKVFFSNTSHLSDFLCIFSRKAKHSLPRRRLPEDVGTVVPELWLGNGGKYLQVVRRTKPELLRTDGEMSWMRSVLAGRGWTCICTRKHASILSEEVGISGKPTFCFLCVF